jgi:hypothetical protein
MARIRIDDLPAGAGVANGRAVDLAAVVGGHALSAVEVPGEVE